MPYIGIGIPGIFTGLECPTSSAGASLHIMTKDVEQAKAFLRKRLSAEQSMSSHLEDELLHFANKLLALYKKYGVAPGSPMAESIPMLQLEIDKLVENLKDTLYEDIEDLCVYADEDDKDNIIVFINQEAFGITLQSQIGKYAEQIRDSIKERIGSSEQKNFTSLPWKIGAFYAMDRLLRTTIGRSWMHTLFKQNSTAKGFYIRRGSTYPCALCDGEANVYHPIEDMNSVTIPIHPNCVCWIEFVY